MRRVLLIAGTHGDEPSGVYAVQRLLQEPSFLANSTQARIDVLPLVNPSGFALGTRANGAGVDLNRCFPDQHPRYAPPEVHAIRRALSRVREPYHLVFSLHEDRDRSEFYLYDSAARDTPPAPALFRIVAEAGVPLYTGIDDASAQNAAGNNQVTEGYCHVRRDHPAPTLEEWMRRSGRAHRVVTIETPGLLPLEQKVSLAMALCAQAVRSTIDPWSGQ